MADDEGEAHPAEEAAPEEALAEKSAEAPPIEEPAAEGEADAPVEGEASAEAADAISLNEGEAAALVDEDAAAAPAEGEAPPQDEAPAEGEAPADGEAAADGEAVADGEAAAPAEGDAAAPAEGGGGEEGKGAVGAGEGEAPEEVDAASSAEGGEGKGGEGADGALAGKAGGGEGGGGAPPAEGGGEGGAEAAGGEGGEGGEGAEGDGAANVEGMSDEQLQAATKIQSIARGKSSRERIQRIKMGEEDPFAEGGEKVRKAKKTADGAAVEGDGEGEASLDESGAGEAVEGGEGGQFDDEEMDDAEARAVAELKAREEKHRLETEARQARITERLEIGKKYAAAVAQREALVSANTELQRKLAAHLAAKRSEEQAATTAPEENAEVSQGDMQTRYFQALRQVADNRAELEKVQLSYDHMVLDMKTRLEQKQEKVRELKETFSEVKKGVALGTSGGGTGRLIPVKLLKQLEEQAGEKEAELEKVRLKNIHLRNQLRQLEGNLRRKEELSNELHLIDFEQLKIENQTLNEKIEERNEELLKLRKKTTTTVQVLTHLKEKLQFVQAENQLLKVELAELEAELSTHRDALTRAKHDRDSLRSENLRLRGEAGLIGNNDLLRDFDGRKKDIASMQVTLEGLKGRHRTLREQVVDMSAKQLQQSY